MKKDMLNEFHDDSVGLIRDLTLQVAYYRRLLEAFERDALTGFYRREKFEEYAKNIENSKSVAVIFFDVNGLKEINDQFGHEAGDMLIQKAADSISVYRSEQSEVFRLGGDEFAAVMLGFGTTRVDSLVANWRERLMELNKDGVKCEIAHGTASHEIDGESLSFGDLLQKADERMYENKQIMKTEVKT